MIARANAAVAIARRRPRLAAALFYALVALVFLGPGLMPGRTLSNNDVVRFDNPWFSTKPAHLVTQSNPDLGDAAQYLTPFLEHTVRRMPHVPLWDPYIMGGRPYLANDQSAVFGPFTAPAYVLPFWKALGWIGVLKLWVAAFGTFLLGRALGMSLGGALLAGLVYALNLRMVTWLIYPTMGIWALIPWMLYTTERLVRRPGVLPASGLAAVTALQFLTGHIETSFHAFLMTGGFFALRFVQKRRAGPPGETGVARHLGPFAAALAAGTALAAVQLVPFGELLGLSADIRSRAGLSIDRHLPIQDAIGLLLPDYWGRPTQTSLQAIMLERSLYVGALPLLLAGAALILRPRLERVWIAVAGFVALGVVIGIPPIVQIVTRIPPFDSGHNTRLVIVTVLALSLLAGWGLDEVRAAGRRVAPRRARAILAAGAGLLLLPAVIVVAGGSASPHTVFQGLKVAWLFVRPPTDATAPGTADIVRMGSLIVWLTLAGAGLMLIALRLRGRLNGPLFAGLAVLIVLVDLFRAGMGQNPAIAIGDAKVPVTPAIRYLERTPTERFVSTEDVPQSVIPLGWDLQEARGYDLPIVRRYDRLWRSQVTPQAKGLGAALIDIPLRFPGVTPRALRTLRLLGVTHILRASRVPYGSALLPAPPLRFPGVTRVYNGADSAIYRVGGALPRAWAVGRQQVVAGDDAELRAITSPGFAARRVAVTPRAIPGLPSGPGAARSPGTVRVTSYAPERVSLRARLRAPGLVVLSDNDFPGWKATVDGRAVPIHRVDYLFRGVSVGRGAHTIEYRYEPASWRVGWIVSLVSILGLALAVGIALVRRRRTA